MTSTSSSSSERMTACAPVICCGATVLGCDAGAASRLAASADVPLARCADCRWSRGGCAHDVLYRLRLVVWISDRCSRATKNPRQRLLYEGCASMLVGYARLSGLRASTREPITTSNPRVCITVDGSLRTGQRSNSVDRRPAGRWRRDRCDDGGVSSPPPLHRPSSSGSRRWRTSRSGSSPSACSPWCSPIRRGSRRCWSFRSLASLAIVRYRTVADRDTVTARTLLRQPDGARGRTSTACASTAASWALAHLKDGSELRLPAVTFATLPQLTAASDGRVPNPYASSRTAQASGLAPLSSTQTRDTRADAEHQRRRTIR